MGHNTVSDGQKARQGSDQIERGVDISVGPKYEFVLIDKGIVERVAVTFSGYRQ